MTDRTFFIADTHFNHANIIDMSNRPFRSIEAMNSALVSNWNSVVMPRDTVWFLGDFAMGPVDEAHKIFKKLNGNKHLVRGNHDKASIADWGWGSVSDQKMITVDGQRVFLSHYPTLEWPGYYQDVVHLYGHVHGNRTVPGRAADVGVDVWGYRPVQLSDILPRMSKEPKQDPETVNDRLSGHARRMLEIADESFETWEKNHLSAAIEQTIVQVTNDILSQRHDQHGYRDLKAAPDPSGPRM